jgi:tripartite-type tricarboxylate transporter receptor subunit TctC
VVAETLPGFEVRIANLLLATPATAPGEQVAWSRLAQAALSTPEAAARFATWGLDPGSVAGSDRAHAFIDAARARWSRVVREAGMRVE